MSKASGYSLWLVPDTSLELYRVLARCITAMARKYQTPNFVPHATLLGGVAGDEKIFYSKTQKLAGLLEPYEIQLGEVGSDGIYFQILFLRIEQTAAVMRANALAREVFGVDKGVYSPHLSLTYGDFSPEKIAMLQDELAQQGHSISGGKFLVCEIELWRTEGAAQDWHRVATFPLKS